MQYVHVYLSTELSALSKRNLTLYYNLTFASLDESRMQDKASVERLVRIKCCDFLFPSLSGIPRIACHGSPGVWEP